MDSDQLAPAGCRRPATTARPWIFPVRVDEVGPSLADWFVIMPPASPMVQCAGRLPARSKTSWS